MIEVGVVAPSFQLPDKDGKMHTLEEFRGHKVVLYFYPKDNTPGCSKQACAFRDNMHRFHDKNVVIIGISKDSIQSHQAFVEQFHLNYLLLSDIDLQAIQAYGVWVEKNMYGKKYMGVSRSTFIIDEMGVVEKVYKRASPDKNAGDIVDYLEKKALQ